MCKQLERGGLATCVHSWKTCLIYHVSRFNGTCFEFQGSVILLPHLSPCRWAGHQKAFFAFRDTFLVEYICAAGVSLQHLSQAGINQQSCSLHDGQRTGLSIYLSIPFYITLYFHFTASQREFCDFSLLTATVTSSLTGPALA